MGPCPLCSIDSFLTIRSPRLFDTLPEPQTASHLRSSKTLPNCLRNAIRLLATIGHFNGVTLSNQLHRSITGRNAFRSNAECDSSLLIQRPTPVIDWPIFTLNSIPRAGTPLINRFEKYFLIAYDYHLRIAHPFLFN